MTVKQARRKALALGKRVREADDKYFGYITEPGSKGIVGEDMAIEIHSLRGEFIKAVGLYQGIKEARA